ncbi:hypothetical protein [Kribbella sindirgiensis]|uniref:Uncharacterized protein n=1 Tax=Kribbella sindirgiensis TaxID=1124744 RepID=A0A4R0I4Y3_9ACTN|nr:hypothetical protein [Kribbella sindirgiensis]TCC21584.1 hypothetical protein E0H50_35460 [Kribbella sindirgiensis]
MERRGFSLGGKAAVDPHLALYRAVWRVFGGVSVVLGIVAAGLLLPVDILGIALLAAPVAGATAFSLCSSDGFAGWTRRQLIAAAAAGAAVTTLVLGLTAVLGASVFWLAALLAVTSPPVVQWCCVRVGFGPAAGPVDGPKHSTAALCKQWRDSYDALRDARTDNQRLRIVMERQRCLDELGRRDPEGLQAWLASAASAAGDPARFLRSQ